VILKGDPIQIMLRYRMVKSKLSLKKLVLVPDGCSTVGTSILVAGDRYHNENKVVIIQQKKLRRYVIFWCKTIEGTKNSVSVTYTALRNDFKRGSRSITLKYGEVR